MSIWHNGQIAELSERLLATREQRENWAKFAMQMLRERDAMRAERDALVRAIDDAMVSAHIGVFNPGDDPKDAINKLAVYEQGVGEYFVKAERDRLAACVERVESLVNDHGWSRGLGADDVVTISTPDALVLTHALTTLLDEARARRAALEDK
jgi:hypothetical protein